MVRLAEGLKQRGHQPEILCLFEEGRLAPAARQKGISVLCLNAPSTWGPSLFLRTFKALRKSSYDLLHTYLFGFHLFAGLPARLLGIPVVLSSRRDVDLSQTKKVLWLEKAGNLFVDRVVCNSEAVKTWAGGREGLPGKKIKVIYNGIDLNEFKPAGRSQSVRKELGIPDGAAVIGTVANFSFKKGYAYLLEAAERVLRERPDVWFLLAGFGPLEGEMKRKAAESPHFRRIVFAGERHDIPCVLEAMDLFVFASLWEGLPNVVLEALAMGKPVISTPVGGVPEVIHSGEEGVLVPLRDPSAMAQAIFFLLDHPDEREKLAGKGRQKIQNEFSLEGMLNAYENFYLSFFPQKVKACAESSV